MTNKQKELPNTGFLAVLLIIGLAITAIGVLLDKIPAFILSPSELGNYSFRTGVAIISVLILKAGINIFIASWLYVKSGKQNENKLTWTVLGLFFGLVALVLFYFVILYKTVKELTKKFDDHSINQNNLEG